MDMLDFLEELNDDGEILDASVSDEPTPQAPVSKIQSFKGGKRDPNEKIPVTQFLDEISKDVSLTRSSIQPNFHFIKSERVLFMYIVEISTSSTTIVTHNIISFILLRLGITLISTLAILIEFMFVIFYSCT
eukprot:TRINITY_DN995_c0_g1_i1.p1 TRINITY_DN995_c0_g1~~TRINITY_DN995_c0_g1_i1.p1  ORF type:complete len:132 (-),score=21.41 TRINITY_DN995_c0_g1_i1:57-452(-)